MILKNKRIILGVTGSIAAYKAADLASKLAQAGALVDTVLTQAAERFISPLTFQSVTGRPAFTDGDLWNGQSHVLHQQLAAGAGLLIIAPLTAHTLAKLTQGLGNDLLSLVALSADCPLLIAPAMDGGMCKHPAVQENLRLLRERGAVIVGPEHGHLASGLEAVGRMSEPSEILGQARYLLSRSGPLKNRVAVITAGGTQEPVDPVRVLANRSSGKQGFALAQAALDAGAQVILIAGPTALSTPIGAQRKNVHTAEEMAHAVLHACHEADALIMTAAVADFKPSQPARQKIKKDNGLAAIDLEPTPDILKLIERQRRQTGFPKIVIGFAAESECLIENAMAKLKNKNLSLIAANNVSDENSGFGADVNQVTLIGADGAVEPLPRLPKTEIAQKIIQRLLGLLANSS